MNKQQLYDAIIGLGIKDLPHITKIKLAELQALYDSNVAKNTTTENSNPNSELEIKTLVFANSGYCEELKCSYYQGYYRPKTVNEYKILRKFAKEEI